MNEFADQHYQRALHLSDIGRWKEAIIEAMKCLANEPQHYRALCTISRCHYQLGDAKKALEFAGKAIEADPTQEWAYRLQSAVYSQKNKPKKRIEAALEAVKQEPESILALQSLAYAQMARTKFKDALQTAEKVRQLAPDSIEAHKTLGYAEFNLENFAAAEENFRRALQIQADDDDTLNMLGETLLKKAEKTFSSKNRKPLISEAVNCFRQALVINPHSADARKNLQNARLRNAAESPFFRVAIAYNLLLLVFFALHHKSWRSYLPEMFNLINKSLEISALYWITGLSLLIVLYAIAGRESEKKLPEKDRRLFELVDKPTVIGKLAAGFWLIISAYPIYLLVWQIISLNFATFGAFTFFDWVTFLTGLILLGVYVVLIIPYLFGKSKTVNRG
jgi:tetratricopeptide (TPR) repeat protein